MNIKEKQKNYFEPQEEVLLGPACVHCNFLTMLATQLWIELTKKWNEQFFEQVTR